VSVTHDDTTNARLTRVCKACGAELPITEFYITNRWHKCKQCISLQLKYSRQQKLDKQQKERPAPPAETLSQAIAAARALGLSYGEYTARGSNLQKGGN